MKKYLVSLFVLILVIGVFVFKNFQMSNNQPSILTKPTAPIYGTSSFRFGAATQKQDKTVKQYIQTLADQIKRYNMFAAQIWPNNKVINRSAIVEFLDTKEIYLIQPDGTSSPLSTSDLKQYKIDRQNQPYGFGLFTGQGLQGMYLAASKADLLNYNAWQKYFHLGTYDLFITFAHEQFHLVNQANWLKPSKVPNQERDEFEKDTKARAKRILLIEQLMDAIADPSDQNKILSAVATYKDYQDKYKTDYDNSVYFDNIEGTAYYYELYTSLYAAYPDEITSKADADKALSIIFSNHNPAYLANGLVTEGYNVGGFAGVLLDRLGVDWKQMVTTSNTNPMQILEHHFDGQQLPTPEKEMDKDEYQNTLAKMDAIREGKFD